MNPLSLRSWYEQLSWADPLSLAVRGRLPFNVGHGTAATLLAPVIWILAALVLAGCATIRASLSNASDETGNDRRTWGVLATCLIAIGIAGPDTLGVSHGQYLPQRVALLGLAVLIPALELDFGTMRWMGGVSTMALVVAILVQSAWIWDYARVSRSVARTFWNARRLVGTNQRIATLLVNPKGRFRANPLIHADSLLGIGTGNILWSNYETRHYYFPVQFVTGLDRPDPAELERLSLQDDPRDADVRARNWERLLDRYHETIDVLAVWGWGADPRLDAISSRDYQPEASQGPLCILRRRTNAR